MGIGFGRFLIYKFSFHESEEILSVREYFLRGILDLCLLLALQIFDSLLRGDILSEQFRRNSPIKGSDLLHEMDETVDTFFARNTRDGLSLQLVPARCALRLVVIKLCYFDSSNAA